MVSLATDVSVPAARLDRLVGALPTMIQRFRLLSFDPDGVAVFPEGRREGLRLLAGEHAAVGARYRVELSEDQVATATEDRSGSERTEGPARARQPPFELEIVVDDPQTMAVTAESDGMHWRISLDRPAVPGDLTLHISGELAALPAFIGRDLTAELTVRLSELALPGDQPQVTGTLRLRRLAASVQARLRPVATHQSVWVATKINPMGLLRPATAVWPFVRKRLQAQYEQTVRAGLVESWNAGATFLDGLPDSPDEVADLYWTEMSQALDDKDMA